MKTYRYLTILAAAVLLAAGCDKTHVDEDVAAAPEVESFTPASAPIGAKVQVTGKHLNNVTGAWIGDVQVTIAEKVSDSRLSIVVGRGVSSGKIKLVNPSGEGVSEEDFNCSYVVPSANASLLPAEAEMGAEILISGTNLLSVSAVYFTADGQTKSHEATIVNASESELVVRVPYVEDANAKITFGYFDGSADVVTPLDGAPSMTVIRYVPRFDAVSFEKTAVGKSLVLTGEYLNNVDKITVGGFDANMYKESGKITFTVPAGDFQDGDTQVSLEAWYFENNENIVLDASFTVFVPFVKYWENVTVWAQGRTEYSEYTSFFSPETGIVYENRHWKDVLDTVAMHYKNAVWSNIGNVPKTGIVSDLEYNSVVPYFFFSGVSGNELQLNSPANSNGQLKNFWSSFEGGSQLSNRIAETDGSLPGTPILTFLPLDSTKTAHKVLRDKVVAGEIEDINETLFPIDVAASTIAGISVTGISGGVKSSKWCDHPTGGTPADDLGYKPDAVFLVAYYGNCGYNPSSRAANIRRLGLLHVTNVDWRAFSGDYRGSSVTFNCYWQKYDYDYSKL